MRLAVLADTHLSGGRRRLPERCRRIASEADVVIHAGDFTSGEALDEIEGLARKLVAVQGNVDAHEVTARLPPETTVALAGVEIAVIHDAGAREGRLARLRRRFPTAHAVIFGHSHLPLCERDGDFQIFNPGSPTQRRRAPEHTMGIAEVAAGGISFEHVTIF